MRRIVVFGIFLALLTSFKLSHAAEVQAACVWNWEMGCIGTCTGGYCGGTSSLTCRCIPYSPPTATPTCSPYCSAFMYTDCAYGCIPNCSGGSCKPAPTSTPTPSCRANGSSCYDPRDCCSGYCSPYNNCAAVPTATPRPTNTPTPTPTPSCEGNDNNICNTTSTPYCEFTCDGTIVDGEQCSNTGSKTVRCSTNSDCFDRNTYCSVTTNIVDLYNCPVYNSCPDCIVYGPENYCNSISYCYWDVWCRNKVGVTPIPPQPTPTTYCQPYLCQNVGAGNYCTIGGTPYFLIGGCSSASSCDNCRGTACNWCPGSTPVPQPTPTAGCTETCSTDPRYLTTCANSTFSICGGSINCYGSLYANCGAECSNYNTGTTYTAPNGCGICNGCNSFPQFITGSLRIKNSDGVLVTGEGGGTTLRNHICQTTFQDSVINPRRARFEVSVTDGDGWSTIVEAGSYIRWNSVNYPLFKLSGSGLGGTMYANIDFPAANPPTGVENIYLEVKDSVGGSTGVIDSLRDFKAWNCEVSVSGGVFDGSAGVSVCAGSGPSTPGYTVYVGDNFNFLSLRFSRSDNNSLKSNMTINGAARYSSPENLTWGRSYINLPTDFNYNGEDPIEGTFPQVRISGGSVSGFICGPTLNLGSTSVVNPYSSVASVVVDYSTTVNQEAWWQVEGGGIRMTNTVSNMVPVTCVADGTCREAMSVDDIVLTNSNGLVSGASIVNNSGCGDLCRIGMATDRYYTANLLNKTYSYSVLRQEYLVKYGEGVEVANDWDLITGDTGNEVFFVNGNLVIDSNLTLLANEFKMVIASGNITIDPTVTRVDGIYLADNGFNIGGGIDVQLVIQGILHSSSGNVTIDRTYVDGSLNNTSPAVLIKYRPDIIFSMPTNLTRALSGWKAGI